MKWVEFGFLAAALLLLAAIFHFIPRFRKRNLYFGVTVAPQFRESEEGCAIAREFRSLVWAGTVGTIILLGIAMQFRWDLLSGLIPLIQGFTAMAAWVRAWRRTRRYSSPPHAIRAAELFQRPERLPGGPIAAALPLLGPAGAALYLWARYGDLPLRYPAHWNAAGQVDRWVQKSPAAVFFPPAMAGLVLVLLLLIALAIHKRARRGSSGERPGWSARHRRLNLRLLITLMWALSAMLTVLSLGPLLPARTMAWSTWITAGGMILLLAAFVVPLFRMSMEPTGGTDATPDECWKFGVFYYNPDDPALIVEKREGPGFTLNFGNRLAWGLIALLLLLTVGPVVYALRLH